jgi:hypothetical protein
MRINDLLEFAPTTPEEDEKRLATFPGQTSQPEAELEPETQPDQQDTAPVSSEIEPQAQPELQPTQTPVQAPVTQSVQAPAAQPAPVQIPEKGIPINSNFGRNVVGLIAKRKEMDLKDPARLFIDRLVAVLDHFAGKSPEPIDEGIVDSVKAGYKKVKDKLSTTSFSLVHRAQIAFYNAVLERVRAKDPELAAKFEQLVAQSIEELGPIEKEKSVKTAMMAAIKGIELNTKGEIVRMDAELEQYAHDIAKRLGLEKKWARNLIGMFGVAIPREDRDKFLKLCKEGKALDINAMLKKKEGNLEDVITKMPPTVKQVFDHVKSTLLDISLSTGQRDATGPFEAMLCIMGGATKLSKGDLEINGKAYEVKGSSITVGLTPTGTTKSGYSGAWLDASKNVKGATVKSELYAALADYVPATQFTPKYNAIVDQADFRADGIPALQDILDSIPSGEKIVFGNDLYAAQKQIMLRIHSLLFPSIKTLKTKKYNFEEEVEDILNFVLVGDYHAIAKKQGIMAMLEYNVGEYQSSFILYNKSTQQYKIIEGFDDIISLAKDPDAHGVRFGSNTVTMNKKSDKAYPGIYYGPTNDQTAYKDYVAKIAKEKGYPIREKTPKTEKTPRAKKSALNEVDDFIKNYL